MPPPELIEALAGRYRFEGEIGSGGMATVYLADDLKHHRRVAVKVLRPDLATVIGTDRFLREIDIAARLNHPHILMLLDSGEAAGLLYYVMPYVDGISLRDRLARDGELPVADTIRVLRDVADALAHAHAHGVVHRDIKPDNVMLSGRHALVTDFGVARAVTEASDHERITTTGVALGTPAYMSPEQATADRNVDHRADIYAFGTLAYELLAGRPPFVRSSAQAVLAAHVSLTPEPVQQHRKSTPPVLAALIMRCLEKNPADRWQTADELLAALEALVTPGTGTTPVATKSVGRSSRRRLVSVAAAILLLGIAATALVSVLRRRGATPAQSSNTFAVAPFDMIGPGVEDIGLSIAELVQHRLDGAGPLTGVPLSAIEKRWRGPADRAAALRLGRDVSAGMVLFGRLVGIPGDSIQVTATLLDVIADRPIADYETLAPKERWLDVSDSLAVWTLETVSRVRQLAAVPLRSIGSTNPAAIKAFITGDTYYRRSAYDSARVFYEEAVSLDSSFALAWSHLGRSKWNADLNAIPDFLHAGRLNRGLARRETLVLEWDSLYASYQSAFTGDAGSWERFRRLAALSDRLVSTYPLDAEAWYMLGEWRFHYGRYLGTTDEDARQAFAESMRLDSGFAEVRAHYMELTLHLDGATATRRFIKETRTTASGFSAERDSVLLLMLDPDLAASPAVDAILRTFSDEVLLNAAYVLKEWPDDTEASVRLARIVGARTYDYRVTRSLAYRGHLAEARAEQAIRRIRDAVLYPAIARLGGVPVDSAGRTFQAWLADSTSPTFREVWWYQALRWWLMQGDSASLRRVIDLTHERYTTLPPSDTAFTGYVNHAARAYLQLAAGDTIDALRGLEALPLWPFQYAYHEWLMRVELLEAVGRLEEAAALLAKPPFQRDWGLSPEYVLADLLRGRANERLGNRDAAIEAYTYVERIWRNADPVLQTTYVAEARTALARLIGETGS